MFIFPQELNCILSKLTRVSVIGDFSFRELLASSEGEVDRYK